MRHSKLIFLVVPFLFGAMLLSGRSPKADGVRDLRSFYVVSDFFSDSLIDGFTQILDVAPDGNNVRVRVIRISWANLCSQYLVRAAERELPNTTVRKTAGSLDPCSFSEVHVDEAVKAAAPKAVRDRSDSASTNIVAQCGTKERVLQFPYPAEVDFDSLQGNHPDVSALWNLGYKLRDRIFGKGFRFTGVNEPPDPKEKEYEDLGMKLVPEIVAGKFQAGFDPECANTRQPCDGNYPARVLKDYTKAPLLDPSSVVLVNASSLALAKSDLPRYPIIAQRIKLFGEVRLRIVPDLQTGLVKDVQLTKTVYLLGDLSVAAAKKWEFVPGSQSGEPVEAILKFSICPGD